MCRFHTRSMTVNRVEEMVISEEKIKKKKKTRFIWECGPFAWIYEKKKNHNKTEQRKIPVRK